MRSNSILPSTTIVRARVLTPIRVARTVRCQRWLAALVAAFTAAGSLAQDTRSDFVQPDYSEYGWIEFGGAVIADTDGRLRHGSFNGSDTVHQDVRLSLSPGFAVAGGFGERFTQSFIAELQGGLFYHNIDEIRLAPTGSWSPDADLLQVPILVNFIFEAPLRSRFKPFLGAGAGAVISWLHIDDRLPPLEDLPGPRVASSSTEINFAWQGFAGVRVQLARQGILSVTYRAVATGSPQWSLKEKETGQSAASLKLDDVLVHSVTLGFLVPF